MTIGLDPAVARQLAQTLTAEFSGRCRGVEIGAAHPADCEGAGDEAHGNRVFLRHYCVHLAGPDPARPMPDYPADRAAARGFNGDIGRHAERWRRDAVGTAAPAVLARRVARKTLLAVAGLVSVHDNTWTTDRVTAAHRFGVIRPELAAPLDTLVAWCSDRTVVTSRSVIRGMLDGVVAAVVEEFATRIGLWASAADATPAV